ncbi:hypothetical protein F511_15408 [Dorcoceras hygrometricum]|uniref:Uncharacterized protein n=1 Tax=Dorcoceras hygrometricum TaxID=472368 RepID=A0A2Z7BTJ3_9LAMI|nr:hypothetical protein F511_15408 [Dorcoceras hygrometricum]
MLPETSPGRGSSRTSPRQARRTAARNVVRPAATISRKSAGQQRTTLAQILAIKRDDRAGSSNKFGLTVRPARMRSRALMRAAGRGRRTRRRPEVALPKISPPVLNTLSSVSVRESRIQYLCDPQWFRDTASRGPTTIAAPKSQFRTCPSDHDSIGYPCTKASGESSTTKHRLLHASGPHPIPPPDDPN